MTLNDKLNDILARLTVKRRNGNQYSCICPAHDDKKESLSVSLGEDKILMYCHAGCDRRDILETIGKRECDLFADGDKTYSAPTKRRSTHITANEAYSQPKVEKNPRKSERGLPKNTEAVYPYHDAQGNLVFEVVRKKNPKTFRMRQPDPEREHYYYWDMDDVTTVPYNLPNVTRAIQADSYIFIVEGEKDVQALANIKCVATCNPGGAGKWLDCYSEYLRDAHIIIIPDNDVPGCKHASIVAHSVRTVAASVKVLQLPGLEVKGDVSDWLKNHTPEEFFAEAENAPIWELGTPIEPSPEAMAASGKDGKSKKPARVASEEDLANARASIAAAKEAGTNAAVYEVIEQLAMLPKGEYLDVARDLKNSIDSIDLRELKGLVSRARKSPGRERTGDYPRLVVNNRQPREMGDEALSILENANNPAVLFVRSGEPVMISIDEQNSARIQRMSGSHMMSHLAKNCDFVIETEDGERNAIPPRCIEDYLMAEQRYPFPALSATTSCPPVRPDGSLCEEPGYDPETGLYYHQKSPCDIPEVSTKPTTADLTQARALLEEIICDFPFDSQASKANAIALLISPVLRSSIDGLPMGALVDAPKQKSGKGLLSQVAAIIATGDECAVTPAPFSDEEWGKLISSLLLDGPSMLVFDNIKHVLGGGSLEAALTAKEYKPRILGSTKTLTLPNKATWIFNGNNLKTTDDMVTRLFVIRIDPQMSDPEDRTGFRHPNLKRWVSENRGRIIAAIVTMYRAWLSAGCPSSQNIPVVGAYEGWAHTIGNILEYAGIRGFLGNRKQAKLTVSNETPQWEAFLLTWQDEWGDTPITVKDFLGKVEEDAFVNSIPSDLARAIDQAKGPAGKSVNAGRVFAQRANTRFGKDGLHIYRDGERARAALWRLGTNERQAHPVDESVSLNESISPDGDMHNVIYVSGDAGNISPFPRLGYTDSIDSLDSSTLTVPESLADEPDSDEALTIPLYECQKCHSPVALKESKKNSVIGEYSCPCGHSGQVDKATYQIWQRRRQHALGGVS